MAFKSIFGISPETASLVYRIGELNRKKVTPKHFLWGVALAKQYGTETSMASMFRTTRKTFRKRTYRALKACADILPLVVRNRTKLSPCLLHISFEFEQVKWENRFARDRGKTCKVTVDGTDCPINDPKPFNTRWYSHKFRGAGLRYELAVCIQTGWIVWVNGPYPCGSFPDITIFRHRLIHKLGPTEKVEADRGYRGEDGYIRTPESAVSQADRRAAGRARARHETINSRLKTFKCLSVKFRHPLEKHVTFFGAVTVFVQVGIMNGEKPWQLAY